MHTHYPAHRFATPVSVMTDTGLTLPVFVAVHDVSDPCIQAYLLTFITLNEKKFDSRRLDHNLLNRNQTKQSDLKKRT